MPVRNRSCCGPISSLPPWEFGGKYLIPRERSGWPIWRLMNDFLDILRLDPHPLFQEDKLDLTPQQAHYLDCASQFFNDAGAWSVSIGYHQGDCPSLGCLLEVHVTLLKSYVALHLRFESLYGQVVIPFWVCFWLHLSWNLCCPANYIWFYPSHSFTMWDNLGYLNGLGSGMDAPLMAIRDLFGVAGKSHLVKYMRLVFTHHLLYPFSLHPFFGHRPSQVQQREGQLCEGVLGSQFRDSFPASWIISISKKDKKKCQRHTT